MVEFMRYETKAGDYEIVCSNISGQTWLKQKWCYLAIKIVVAALFKSTKI